VYPKRIAKPSARFVGAQWKPTRVFSYGVVMRHRFLVAVLAVVFASPFAARADLVGTVTLALGDRFSFETGVTTSANVATGDVRFNQTNLTPQANVGIFNFKTSGAAGTAQYNSLTQQALAAIPASSYTDASLNNTALVVGDVLAVHTRGGLYAKVLITAFSAGSSLSLQYTTFGAAAGGANAPMITSIENAATNIPPGLPNAAIAQGALFVVKGKNLGPENVVVATAFPLRASISGTSIQVTVGGTTVDAIMYYSLATQIAAILPSKTPAGTGTLTVTYNGSVSSTAPITVVTSNVGVFTLNSSGFGDAVATLPATNTVVSTSNAPNPGEVVTLWATGLGAVSGDESQPAQQTDLTNVPLKVFIGGQPANVLFRGRNACCSGVDTIYVTVPQGLTGCANSVIMQIGNVVSNATSIPIGTNGRNCVPIAPQQTSGGLAPGTHSFGGLSLVRQPTTISAIGPVPAQTIKMDIIGGAFEKVTTSGTPPQGSDIDVASYGSCVVRTRVSGQPVTTPTVSAQFLDAGTITVNGPGINGSRQIAKTNVGGTLLYSAILDNTATTLAAGTYNFTGSGGPDVGSFTASYTMPPVFTWTNPAATATIIRANGVTVDWTGGDPAGYVTISGQSNLTGATAATTVSVSFTCTARVSDGSFTVPPVVLLAMPPTAAAPGATFAIPGTISVSHVGTTVTQIQASGIEFGGIGSVFTFGASSTYQ
jgi:uncharacterized protein (TIGR03437 family)